MRLVSPNTTGAYLSWTPYHGRSQGFIDALDLAAIYIHYLKEHRPLYAPFKYGPQFVSTLYRLYKTRPRAVFVMNPPAFAALAAYLYCLTSNARYVMDCHSGVFEHSRWRWCLPLQRFLGRRAAAVLVTNPMHERSVAAWGAQPLIVGDPPMHIPAGRTRAHTSNHLNMDGPSIFVVNRFHPHEAVAEVLDAAHRLPHVRFRISGDRSRAKPEWLANCSPNVEFTGWLSIEEFWQCAWHADAILTLTTEENTILRGGWEAMFLGQPLITSDTQALRNYFTDGAVFVNNTPAGIAEGVTHALTRLPELRAAMQQFRDEKDRRWHQDRHKLEQVLGVEFATPKHD